MKNLEKNQDQNICEQEINMPEYDGFLVDEPTHLYMHS